MGELAKRAPNEMVYASTDASARNKPVMALLQLISAPVIVAAALSMIFDGTVALVGMIITAVLSIWWWKRAPKLAEKILRVDRGTLYVMRGHREEARYALKNLLDVALENKTVQKIQEGGSAIPAMRFIDSQVAPDQEVSRIVLVGTKTRHVLADEYVANMEATEWMGKIRVFLRKNGWVPRDEQEAPPSSESMPEIPESQP